MRALAFIAFAASLAAQTTITPTGPGSVAVGGNGTLTISCTGCTSTNLAAIQLTITVPAGVSLGTAATTSSDPSGEQVACGPTGICELLNPTKIAAVADGNVFTVPFTVAPSAKLGAVSVPVSGLLAADINGFNINSLAAGSPYSLTISPSPCDINGDGTINVADIQAVVSGTIQQGTCPITAANGGCTAITTQQVIIAATGGACKIP